MQHKILKYILDIQSVIQNNIPQLEVEINELKNK